MRDYFSEMGLPRRASLDAGEIRESFHKLARRIHPDSGVQPDGEAFEALNRAHVELASCPRRIWHLLELEYGSKNLEKSGGVGERLVDLFSAVGRVIAVAETIAVKRSSASSDLGRALLEEEAVSARASLASVNAEIASAITGYEATLPELDRMIQAAAPDAISSGLDLWRNLTFLEKWRGQIQAKFAQLF